MMMEDLKSMTRLLLTTIAIASLLAGFLIKRFTSEKRKYPPEPIDVDEVSGEASIQSLQRMAKEYGPIYSIRIGANPVVVINSTKLAKEKQSRILRENMLEKIMDSVQSHVKANSAGSSEGLDVRQTFVKELFPFAVKQVIGRDMESIYVEELGGKLSKWQLYDILVEDVMKGAVEIDWRDFFPYLSWVPNKRVEGSLKQMDIRRNAVVRTIVEEQKKLLASGKEVNCFLDILITEAKHLTSRQVEMSMWEPIVEASDTTGVTVEWAMFELAKNPKCQDRLYRELQEVCGDKTVTEDDLPKLKYLNAVFHETLRKHAPVRIAPLRYVHEDVQIGGFDVPAGWQIAINIYGCNHNEEEWENANEFKPERFLEENKRELVDLYKTMAFGAGKRVCTGAVQATLLGSTTIARFVQEFQWNLPLGEDDLADTVSLTTHKLHRFKAIVIPRSSATNN
eukprot:Gb_07574 [translate_table: standard]